MHAKFRKINSLNQSKEDSMIHLADSVMEISVPSILSAFWTFSMMGLLTWEETRRQMWPRETGIGLNVHVSIYINFIDWPWAQWGTDCSWVCIFHPAEGMCTAAHHSSENTRNIYNSSCSIKSWKNYNLWTLSYVHLRKSSARRQSKLMMFQTRLFLQKLIYWLNSLITIRIILDFF